MALAAPAPLARQHRLDGFECGEATLDEWLTRFARAAHASGSARVYVATEGGVTVGAYYALAACQVEAADALPRLLKGEPAQRAVPAVLLARLAVDRRHQGAGVGQSLLRDALLRCVQAADAIGVRALLVQAKGDKARQWYERQGFDPSPTDPFHLMLLLKDVRAVLGER